MLRWLRLTDFVIVEAAEIGFDAGFTALTGETGAGKSILLDALGLALGGRGDAAFVRDGAARADIAAEFAIGPALEAWLAERELAADPGTLLLRRIVEADGRSRGWVNGQPATIALLRELGERLVDIHGQHASQSLLAPGAQRDLLDRFGQLEPQAAAVAAAWSDWQRAAAALAAATSGARERAIRLERLQWEIEEIGQLRLHPGEWDALSTEQQRLAHAKDLLEGADSIALTLARGDDAITGMLAGLQQRLRALAAIDPSLAAAAELIESASIQLDEAAGDLAGYAQRMDLDPERLAEVEQRVSAVFGTARKLKLAPEALPEHLTQLQAEAGALAAAQDSAALERAAAAAETAYREQATALGKARRAAARRLADGVSREIGRLGMADASLQIACEPAPPGPSGSDAVEFRIAAHDAATPRPLAKVASGGELSRIGLAIAVLAARANPVPTLIFDEADAGIGGAVAAVVGELMQRLATDCQVLCVTHLPQVASRADQQLRVVKSTGKSGPTSRIDALAAQTRVDEIARMLGGRKVTETTRAHAAEMLASSRRAAAPQGSVQARPKVGATKGAIKARKR
ncbi:MAG: DNA repair protein RecN [Lautropia sp.]